MLVKRVLLRAVARTDHGARAATRHMETQMNDALSVGKSDMFVVVRDGPPEFPVQTVQIWACQRFSLANVWRLVCKEPPWWAI